jgi:hypothetical protein
VAVSRVNADDPAIGQAGEQATLLVDRDVFRPGSGQLQKLQRRQSPLAIPRRRGKAGRGRTPPDAMESGHARTVARTARRGNGDRNILAQVTMPLVVMNKIYT